MPSTGSPECPHAPPIKIFLDDEVRTIAISVNRGLFATIGTYINV
jgi:hypothetical protein